MAAAVWYGRDEKERTVFGFLALYILRFSAYFFWRVSHFYMALRLLSFFFRMSGWRDGGNKMMECIGYNKCW